jgi:DNA-binding LacI/PurR family transcriptional regulator
MPAKKTVAQLPGKRSISNGTTGRRLTSDPLVLAKALRSSGISQSRSSATELPSSRLQMADIARLAGVSVSTVSRALSASPLINEETRSRIKQLAEDLNYSINLGARNLRLQRNNTIAVVVPFDSGAHQQISDPFFLSIVGSLADALTAQGYDMLLSRVDADHLYRAADAVDAGKAVGLIVIGQWRHHDQLNTLAARRIPMVVWGAELPQQAYCTVGGNNQLGGRLATQHLLKQGRKRLVFLGDPSLPEVFMRKQGYDLAHAEARIRSLKQLEIAVPFDAPAGYSAMTRLCQNGVVFDGVVACSDVLALQAIRAVEESGRSVPIDVSVVGYDDTAVAMYGNPPLSSVHQPVAEAGVALVQALLQQFGSKHPGPITLPVHLVVRKSSTLAV